MSNECDTLGDFLKLSEDEKKLIRIGITGILPEQREKAKKEQQQQQQQQSSATQQLTNGVTREVGAC